MTPAQKKMLAAQKLAAANHQHLRILSQLHGLPVPIQEHRFHKTRKWRLDYAWPELKIAIEIHGSVYSKGRHTRGNGFMEDRIKMNSAQVDGWIVLEFATNQINIMRELVDEAFNFRANTVKISEISG